MGRRKLKTKSKAGGAQKKKQKMEIDDQPSSSSSLDNAQVEEDNQQPSTSGKIDNGPPESKFKESKSEVEDNCSIEDLPPEMLMKIAKCLDIKSLVNCRRLNRRWNGIAREILQTREDLEVSFECETTRTRKLKICKTGRKVLSGFVKCFQALKAAPLYTRFRFNGFKTCVFDDPNWITFISAFGESIKCLKLKSDQTSGTVDDIMELAEKLRNLLLNQLPNLQEFGLHIPFRCDDIDSLLFRLFPPKTSNIDDKVKIPHLKVLYLVEESFFRAPGIILDLVNSAVNLQKIERFDEHCNAYLHIETFQLLKVLGRLHCLQEAVINLSTELLSQLKEMDGSLFKLKKLLLLDESIHNNNIEFWPYASVFLFSLFESSKDTLTDLTMEPLGFLPQLQLPKFSKLTNLDILDYDDEPNEQQVFPSGLNLNEIFPVLKHLTLEVTWSHFFPNDENVDCLPNLTNLVIDYGEMTAEDVTRISQVCPNLKELKLGYVSWQRQNFSQMGTAIWTHLKQLESLDLKIKLDTQANAFPAVDSCFTGLSEEDVIRLHNLIKDEKSTKKKGSQSESEVEMDRQKPSILNLKGLKNLTIKLRTDNMRPGQTISGSVLTKALIVSEKYAFKLMDGLTYKIH